MWIEQHCTHQPKAIRVKYKKHICSLFIQIGTKKQNLSSYTTNALPTIIKDLILCAMGTVYTVKGNKHVLAETQIRLKKRSFLICSKLTIWEIFWSSNASFHHKWNITTTVCFNDFHVIFRVLSNGASCLLEKCIQMEIIAKKSIFNLSRKSQKINKKIPE